MASSAWFFKMSDDSVIYVMTCICRWHKYGANPRSVPTQPSQSPATRLYQRQMQPITAAYTELDDAEPVLAVLTDSSYFFCVFPLQLHFLLSCYSPENLPSFQNLYIIQPVKVSLHHAATSACPIFACHLVQRYPLQTLILFQLESAGFACSFVPSSTTWSALALSPRLIAFKTSLAQNSTSEFCL